MAEDNSDVDADSDEENEQDDSPDGNTEISADLGGLTISVSSDGHESPEETEEMFYRVWDYINEDAEEMSKALQDRMGVQ